MGTISQRAQAAGRQRHAAQAAMRQQAGREQRARERDEVKVLLQTQIEALCRHLLPDGQRHGRYWMARNPRREDKRAGSFWVTLAGVPGAWRDEATGEKGDVFQLIGLVSGFSEFKDIIDWAKSWTGYADIEPRQFQARRQQLQDQADRDKRAEAERLADARNYALSLWLKAKPDLTGTIVARYLAGRGIDLTKLARPARCIRAESYHRHSESRHGFPCMMVAMTGPDNTLWALHRTWLAPDGSGKAPVDPPRKILPRFTGAAMRISRGMSGLAPTEAAKRGVTGPLLICEGVEDGLSIAIARPDLRVWAAGTLGNIGEIVLPDCADQVIVAADNDWDKPQAIKALDKALAKLAAQGRPVRVARSPIGKDFNDVLQEIGT